jgi:NADPH-dependent ferric siderophore reductase
VGALGYVGDETTLPALFKLLQSFKVEENRYAVCGAIGNIVSRDQGKLVGKLMEAAGA